MKQNIPASYETTLSEIACQGRRMGLTSKEIDELRDSLDVLRVWRPLFRDSYGELKLLRHQNAPHDPPDVVAFFEHGQLDIEHTFIEPGHLKKADAIHGKERPCSARNQVPLSLTCGTQDMRNIMWTPGHPKAWEASGVNLATRHELILTTVAKKLAKHRPGGLLVMSGEVGWNAWEIDVIKSALLEAAKLSGAEHWKFVVHNRWNSLQSFSALFSHTHGISLKLENQVSAQCAETL